MTQAATKPTPPASGKFRNAEDWWDSLGNVPMHRIVFDPSPGTATETDVLRLDDHEDRLCELVDGTLVEKTMGYEESLIAAQIIYLLKTFVMPRNLGIVNAPDGMMRILSNRIRIPDVAFVSFDRLPGRKSPGVPIPNLAPDLAIEIISESNTRLEMQIKLQEYFTAGTRLVWYVDPKTRTVDVYIVADQMKHLDGKQYLDGCNVLPGFAVPAAEIFSVS